MLVRLSIVDLLLSIKNKLNENEQGVKVFDTEIPTNEPAPLILVVFGQSQEENSKMLYIDKYSVLLHVLTEIDATNSRIYELADMIQELLTDPIELPEGFELLRQTNAGIQSINRNDNGELHALIKYEFRVAYGYRIK